jgi:hypothetical protein
MVYGPVVLVQKAPSGLPEKAAANSTRVSLGGESLTFSIPGQPVGDFVPFYKVAAGEPYDMYFDVS